MVGRFLPSKLGGNLGHRSFLRRFAIPFLKRIRAFLFRSVGVNIDFRNRWIGPAQATAVEIMNREQHEVIVSTFGPAANHEIASYLKKQFPRALWVADFRDRWSGNPTGRNGGISEWLASRHEKRTCSAANIISAVSAGNSR